MAKDVPEDWNDRLDTVEVIIERHTFMAFAFRAVEAFALAGRFTVSTGVAKTTVVFWPYSRELVHALVKVLDPGETIKADGQEITIARNPLTGL